MTDCCIIGGGIIGLSIARELATRGLSVRLLSRDRERDTASWAAAGIFPPIARVPDGSAHEALTTWSDSLHRQWADELLEETGIDNGLRACGGLHLGATEKAIACLRDEAIEWKKKGVACDLLDAAGVRDCEPAFKTAVEQGAIAGGYLLPDEMQIRPPRHLQALLQSCRLRGVQIEFDAVVNRLDVQGDRIQGVVIQGGSPAGDPSRGKTVHAGCYCLAAGAWSGDLAKTLGLQIETRPIRGQIALLRLPQQILSRVVNLGLEYFVPRSDGRLLIGSTIEDVGFDCSTTHQAIDRLMAFAHLLLGPLSEAILEQTWAGLWPGSTDGLPLMGRAPACANAYLASGHFRAGLHQSTGSAVLLADLITGQPPSIDPAPFEPSRSMHTPVAGAAPPKDSIDAYLARAALEVLRPV